LVPEPPNNGELPTTSSVPSEVPQKQVQLFRDVLQAFEESHLPYAVSGAFALRQHTGICRFTKDLDLFVTGATLPLALSLLRKLGFECEVRDPVWLAKVHRDDYFVDIITGMSNGIIAVEDSWIKRARPAVIYGIETRVLAPEELVASKLFVARRERFDGADIAHVIFGTNGSFDWNREMELVGEHWEILLWSLLLFRYAYPAQSHYVPERIWRQLLRRFDSAITHPDPAAPFRGSLVDDCMFAIDVNEWGLANLMAEGRERRLAELAAVTQPPDTTGDDEIRYAPVKSGEEL
jgi:Nucleotidyl transferase of unknown function (DUF2204)